MTIGSHITRRRFVVGTGATLVGARVAWGQAKRPLVGFLSSAGPDAVYVPAFVQGMSELGYLAGRDFAFEVRYADNATERLPALARELVALQPDVIVAASSIGTTAAADASQRIPVVAPSMGVSVLAVVGNVARPVANVTGLVTDFASLAAKELELAVAMVPQARRVGFLMWSRNTAYAEYVAVSEAAAAGLGFTLVRAEADDAAGLAQAVQALRTAMVDAIVVPSTALFTSERTRIVALAGATRAPAIYPEISFVKDGGLASYGIDFAANYRRGAYFVDRILKGAKPGELPVEQSQPQLAINLVAAREIGYAFSASILARAEEVIE